MIYTAIFLNSANQYGYDIYDAPHSFKSAWSAIKRQMKAGNRLIALIPGSHEVGYEDNLLTGQVTLSPQRLHAPPLK